MRLRDFYQIPAGLAEGPHSPTFERFLRYWFADLGPIGNNELDVTFLSDLTPDEVSLARLLIRLNLPLKHTHIIMTAGLLRDPEAIPILKRMLEAEPDLGWRLEIAGALWRINRDPVYIDVLEEAKSVKPEIFQWVTLTRVLWLEDERAVDFLIDLLAQKDRMGKAEVLQKLNELELGQRFVMPPNEMPHQPDYYRKVRNDPAFRAHMVAAMRKRNAESKNGK